MIAYVDSSVVARFVVLQPDRLTGLASFDERLTSHLTQVECLRSLDRVRVEEGLSPDEIVARSAVLFALLRRMRRVGVSRSVLERAGSSFPLPVKALDAIHLATALQLRDRGRADLVFATHDRAQARAAVTLGFRVVGV